MFLKMGGEDLLPRLFYRKDTKLVAKKILGNILFHQTNNEITAGKIVETEAYYGPEDPASRAANGKTKISKPMWGTPGTTLVYMVHSYWLFNIVTEKEGTPGAVLIRALEPLKGITMMKNRRRKEKIHELCSGPGKLTEALGITQQIAGEAVTDPDSPIIVSQSSNDSFEIGSTHRIGVSQDVAEKRRFYIKGNPHLSR